MTDGPDAVNDNATVDEDSTDNPIDVLGNDSDPDGDTLTVTAVGTASHGTADLSEGGDVSYTPAANYEGLDVFDYTVSDGNGGTDTASVTITVGGVNDGPDAVDDQATVNEDSSDNPIDVLGNDSDPENDALTVTDVGEASNGTASLGEGGDVTYTPVAGYNGSDSFDYSISDGNGGTDTATVTVTVSNVNDPPVAQNDSFTVDEESNPSSNPTNRLDVLANDSDPDGDPLTITIISGPTHGSASVVNGRIHYNTVPAHDYTGPDSITYQISDGNGGTDTAVVSLTVANVNDAPEASDDDAEVDEDSSNNAIAVLANDSDVDGDTLSVSDVSEPSNGSVSIGGGGVTYTPTPGFSGNDSFTYTVSDGNGGTDTATVRVTVNAINHAPDAQGDSLTVAQDSGATTFDPLGNDSDPDGDHLTISAVGAAAHGTASIHNSNKKLIYTPAAGYSGADSFTYTVSDGNGGTDTATVSITVTPAPPPANRAPVASFTPAPQVCGTSSVTVNFVNTSTDPDGNTLTSNWNFGDGGTSLLTNPSHDFTYSGTANQVLYTVTLTVSDGSLTNTKTENNYVKVMKPGKSCTGGGPAAVTAAVKTAPKAGPTAKPAPKHEARAVEQPQPEAAPPSRPAPVQPTPRELKPKRR
ncbi:MAG: tandem-95 repeat protein [Actinobacteria bacterium]|nr:tandem-95 repeat protein [Actinomycetota bacterium]